MSQELANAKQYDAAEAMIQKVIDSKETAPPDAIKARGWPWPTFQAAAGNQAAAHGKHPTGRTTDRRRQDFAIPISKPKCIRQRGDLLRDQKQYDQAIGEYNKGRNIAGANDRILATFEISIGDTLAANKDDTGALAHYAAAAGHPRADAGTHCDALLGGSGRYKISQGDIQAVNQLCQEILNFPRARKDQMARAKQMVEKDPMPAK